MAESKSHKPESFKCQGHFKLST